MSICNPMAMIRRLSMEGRKIVMDGIRALSDGPEDDRLTTLGNGQN